MAQVECVQTDGAREALAGETAQSHQPARRRSRGEVAVFEHHEVGRAAVEHHPHAGGTRLRGRERDHGPAETDRQRHPRASTAEGRRAIVPDQRGCLEVEREGAAGEHVESEDALDAAVDGDCAAARDEHGEIRGCVRADDRAGHVGPGHDADRPDRGHRGVAGPGQPERVGDIVGDDRARGSGVDEERPGSVVVDLHRNDQSASAEPAEGH